MRLIGAESQTSTDLPLHLLAERWAEVASTNGGRRWLSTPELEDLRQELVKLVANDVGDDEGSIENAVDLIDFERRHHAGVAIELPPIWS